MFLLFYKLCRHIIPLEGHNLMDSVDHKRHFYRTTQLTASQSLQTDGCHWRSPAPTQSPHLNNFALCIFLSPSLLAPVSADSRSQAVYPALTACQWISVDQARSAAFCSFRSTLASSMLKESSHLECLPSCPNKPLMLSCLFLAILHLLDSALIPCE